LVKYLKVRFKKSMKIVYKTFLILFCSFNFVNCQSDYVTKSLEYPGKCSVDLKIEGHLGYMPARKDGITYVCGDKPSGCGDEYCWTGQNATIYAINDDCEVEWKYDTGIDDYCIDGSLAIGEEGNIYFYLYGIFHSLSPKGKLNWTVQLGSFGGGGYEQMAIGNDGTIYVSLTYNLFAISPAGETKWSMPLERTEGPIIDSGNNVIIAYKDSDDKFRLSSLSTEGNLNWDYDFGTKEFADRMVIGPSGNLYIISIVKNENIGNPDIRWFGGNVADGEIYMSSFHQSGDLNWRVKLGEGEAIWLNGGGFITGLLIGKDETIYTDYYNLGLVAINCIDGSVKWQFKQPGTYAVLEFIDGQGNIYFISDSEEKIFDQNGNIISSYYAEKGVRLEQGSVVDGDYFFNVSGGGLRIYYLEGSGYSKSAWPMLFHDPQNTNRWNGGS
jgi:hypothetical protein